jgi:type IV pilus assembly protein PilC
MPESYQYKVRDKSGNLVTGTLVADNERLVLERLREMGLHPARGRQGEEGPQPRDQHQAREDQAQEVAIFSRQFATMVNSGLPILRALSILADQVSNKELAKILTLVRNDVEQGASLSAAMAKYPKAFNNLYIAMVKSGETGGMLDDVLLRLADVLEREVHLRQKIKSAMTYPVAVVALVVLIMSAMLLFVVPQFKTIYTQLGGTLPLPTRVLLMASDAVKKYWYVFIFLTFVMVFLFKRYKKTEKGRANLDAIKLKIPIFGTLVPQDRAVAVLEHSRACCSARVSRSCRHSTSWRTPSTTP